MLTDQKEILNQYKNIYICALEKNTYNNLLKFLDGQVRRFWQTIDQFLLAARSLSSSQQEIRWYPVGTGKYNVT